MDIKTTIQQSIEHITPKAAELEPFHKIYCQQHNCNAIFTNAGNYELHLQRRHKIPFAKIKNKEKKAIRLYHCPELDCIYNLKRDKAARHFKHINNLRQHFQKVHTKNFICECCGRTFPTQGQLTKHLTLMCGKRFTCNECGWDFQTQSALQQHSKRKGHPIGIVNKVDEEVVDTVKENSVSKKNYAKQKRLIKKTTFEHTSSDKETQTKASTIHLDNFTNTYLNESQSQCHDIETQTDHGCVPTSSQTEISQYIPRNCDFDDINALYHDIETQTELTLQRATARCTSPMENTHSNGVFLDQILSQTPSAHMHTQTCDAYLLSELGLADIQTQTNWTSFGDDNNKQLYIPISTSTSTSTSTTGAGFAHDELLVSTETQTSFTQCLLDSTADSEVITADAATSAINEESTNTLNHLYNTQHTQTCNLLLEGLFGGQGSDLIANLQSTYTQT